MIKNQGKTRRIKKGMRGKDQEGKSEDLCTTRRMSTTAMDQPLGLLGAKLP
jgi:hypothetical protein